MIAIIGRKTSVMSTHQLRANVAVSVSATVTPWRDTMLSYIAARHVSTMRTWAAAAATSRTARSGGKTLMTTRRSRPTSRSIA
jgi:hypothetical protein